MICSDLDCVFRSATSAGGLRLALERFAAIDTKGLGVVSPCYVHVFMLCLASSATIRVEPAFMYGLRACVRVRGCDFLCVLE